MMAMLRMACMNGPVKVNGEKDPKTAEGNPPDAIRQVKQSSVQTNQRERLARRRTPYAVAMTPVGARTAMA